MISLPPPRRILGGLLFFALAVGVVWMGPDKHTIVLYCAHDAGIAEELLAEFTAESGYPVRILFATDARHSSVLVERIRREAKNPQADVFWEDGFDGMLELREQNLLEPHRGPGWSRIPPSFRDPGGYWAGFSARLRVWAVNTNALPADPSAIRDRLASADLSRVGLPNPAFGSTLTEFSARRDRLGADGMRDYYDSLRQRGLRIVRDNAEAVELTAGGVLDLGFAESGDVFRAIGRGAPLAMLPMEWADGATLCLPKTVAILKGAHNRAGAEALVDFLLRAETESRLAQGPTHPIPLGAADESRLPEGVKALKPHVERGMALHGLLEARRACLEWLRQRGREG